MSELRIKPCPFCGGSQRVLAASLGGMWQVHCWNGCETAGPEFETKGEAIAAWNQIARVPTLPDVMEDGDEIWRIGDAFIMVEIHGGEFPAYVFTNDYHRRPLTITSELAGFLGLPELQVKDGKIVKVEG